MARSLQAQQRELLFAAVDASDQIVMITGADQRIVYVNGAFTRVTGYTPDEALGRKPSFLQGPDTSQGTRVDLHHAIEKGHRVSAEILNYRKSGEPYWVDVSIVPVSSSAGAIAHWIAIERDITARKAQEQETARLAMEDHLTGLPNRRAAEARLQVEFSRARREGSAFAVALMDVDRFKLVNDQYGHQAGDLALTHLAKLLARNMRGGDWIARWGGEEFLGCLHALDARGALIAAERARKLVRGQPVKLPQGDLSLTISTGIALCGPESDSLDAVLASADALLYQAKQSGRDQVLCAGASGGRRRTTVWEGSQVQTALREGRVVAAYQPIVDLRTGDIVGEEALARIVGSGNGPIPAERFIMAAEQLHLAAAIDRTISQRALERMASSGKNGNGGARFINLSAQFLGDPEEVSGLLAHARTLGLLSGDANPVVIEITERQTAELAALHRHLKPLVDEGFRLALDDFGSGNASFMYLTDLPMSFVKVEGWMVGRVAQDPRIRRLVESIVNTAARFELKTIAECVETSESADVLRDVGVDWAQGHFFAEPQLAA
jgi:diguanylate cyclase (GGDEF)-like protein/PAS domain S-box-containing protein